MRRLHLFMAALAAGALLIGLLMTGCEDKINPVSAIWRSWKAGDTVPGYVLSEPSGSRADVLAKAQMWDNYWALELACNLGMVHSDDHMFIAGSDLVFALYISDDSDNIWNGADLIHLVWNDLQYDSPDTVSVIDINYLNEFYEPDISPPTIDGSGDDDIWMILQASTWETKLDIVAAAGDNGLREAYLMAARDSAHIYFKLAWPDPTNTMSMAKNRWHFDGHRWTRSSEEEDMAVFFFPTDQAPAGWDSLGGATIDLESRIPNDGELNVWEWMAGRTNPVGHADDLLATSTELQGDDGAEIYTPNYDPDKSYPPSVQNPAIEPSAGPAVLLQSEAVPFEDTIRP